MLAALRASSVDDLLVVAGAHRSRPTPVSSRASSWARGPGASLRCGLAALPAGVEAAVVVLADGPDLDPRAVDRVIESWRAEGRPRRGSVLRRRQAPPRAALQGDWAEVPDAGARALEARLVPATTFPSR